MCPLQLGVVFGVVLGLTTSELRDAYHTYLDHCGWLLMDTSDASKQDIDRRSRDIFQRLRAQTFQQTDRLFALIMLVQWAAAVLLAFYVSPRTWAGEMSATHLHVYAALFLGGLITAVPVALAWWRPATLVTRHAIAAAQLLMSGLLIHLTGGRIETHFHIFVSLGFLAIYQDWPVLVTGAAVTAADHLVRGILWPESVFGVVPGSEFRIVEHAGWVVFAVAGLSVGCIRSKNQQWATAQKQAEVEAQNEEIQEVLEEAEDARAAAESAQADAEEAHREIKDQQQSLQRDVKRMLEEMERFAGGDLTAELDEDRSGAIGQLYRGFNRAVANIRDIIGELAGAVETTTAAANQISGASEELAAGAQEQSAQADEVAAAMEEMSRTIIDNAQAATRTAAAAEANGETARENGAVVLETVDKMRDIEEVMQTSAETVGELSASSEEIGEIIQTIDEIADQTNLLALNAAIEAARAGEHGDGFAVVADEVRQLAERAAEATGEIETMIAGVQKETQEAARAMEAGRSEVEAGIELAGKAKHAFEEIVAGTEEITERVEGMATATEEQSITSEQISQTVESISTVTAESAEGVEEVAEAATELDRMTDDLQGLVGQFTTGASDAEAAAGQVDRPAG